MEKISVRRMGLALGFTSSLFYLECMAIMISFGREGTILFFNSLLHGIQTEPIIRMNVPPWEALLGTVQTFILGWLTGFLIATFYNLVVNRRKVDLTPLDLL